MGLRDIYPGPKNFRPKPEPTKKSTGRFNRIHNGEFGWSINLSKLAPKAPRSGKIDKRRSARIKRKEHFKKKRRNKL